jgi:hypothetical protein
LEISFQTLLHTCLSKISYDDKEAYYNEVKNFTYQSCQFAKNIYKIVNTTFGLRTHSQQKEKQIKRLHNIIDIAKFMKEKLEEKNIFCCTIKQLEVLLEEKKYKLKLCDFNNNNGYDKLEFEKLQSDIFRLISACKEVQRAVNILCWIRMKYEFDLSIKTIEDLKSNIHEIWKLTVQQLINYQFLNSKMYSIFCDMIKCLDEINLKYPAPSSLKVRVVNIDINVEL